jgi:glycine/D-amino acid oxidase-like deaminating enzyme
MATRIHTPSADDFPARADLVVIGGGVVGAATAFYASRAGLDVLVLERRTALASLTTTRSLEAFRAQFDDAADIAMMKESIGTFERFGEIVGLPGYDLSLHQQGYLFVTQEPEGEGKVAARVAAQRAAGLDDVEHWTGLEAHRRFPWLSADVSAAAFRQRDGWLASHELTYGFAQASGARFFVETELTSFAIAKGRLEGVVTSRGEVRTPRAVVAAGPYSGKVAALAGVSFPITPVRRHRAGIKAHELIPRDAPMSISLETGAHFRPEGPGAWFGWSSAFEEPPREPTDDVRADSTFPALVLDAVSQFAPFWDDVARTLKSSNVTVEAGLYDLTPDARPVIGASGTVAGLYLNSGYSGHGVMGSAAGARRLADLIVGREREEANPFRLARFDDPRTAASGKRPL